MSPALASVLSVEEVSKIHDNLGLYQHEDQRW
jgi:hypothetical protein